MKKQDTKQHRSTFRNWIRNVISVGRKHGYTDKEIRQWIKVYAAKRNIPHATMRSALFFTDLHARGPYKKLSPSSRAAMGRQIQLSPKLRFLMKQFDDELKRWQTAVLRTLEGARNQGEDLVQVKAAIIKPLKDGWGENIFSHYMSFDEFIKRLVPELQISQ